MHLQRYYSVVGGENVRPADILSAADLSIAGVGVKDGEEFDGQHIEEPFEPTFEDLTYFVDDDDPDDDERPDRAIGMGMRLSELCHTEFWTYFDRFVRYWPKRTFHVKYGYPFGFVERKKRGSDNRSLPLFESLAVEMTERHLDPGHWAECRKEVSSPPIWLALHMPSKTTVDCIDIDAKKYHLGYYGKPSNRLKRPIVHLPLEHFQLLKRIYDRFPGRIWCISSETLGVHVWKKHPYPTPSLLLHQQNKRLLAEIGHGEIEAHPMPGRCLRRPFGADYRTITPDGLLDAWFDQVRYFENDGRTPSFSSICQELVRALLRQWQNAAPNVRKTYSHEIQEVADWLKAGCPQDDHTVPDSPKKTTEELVLDKCDVETSLSKSRTTQSANTGASDRLDLAALRKGNWAKELLRLAQTGLEHDDSVATVVHEMAKWLWWIELHHLPPDQRWDEVRRLLTIFVLTKHNGFITRLETGHEKEVISQVDRCVALAQQVEPESERQFAATRAKWANGGYKHPIRIVPAITGQKDIVFSSSCLFTVMCINLDDTLPEVIQARIVAQAGRNKVLPFATRLINRVYSKKGRAYLGRKALLELLGYNNPTQLSKYLAIMERAGVISRGTSYSVGRNGKEIRLADSVIAEMDAARAKCDQAVINRGLSIEGH